MRKAPLVTERMRVIPFRWKWWERVLFRLSRKRWMPYRTVSKVEGVFLESTGYIYGVTLDLREVKRIKFQYGDTLFEEDAPWTIAP